MSLKIENRSPVIQKIKSFRVFDSDYGYMILFPIYYGLFYTASIVLIGLKSPNGLFYSAFVEKHLDIAGSLAYIILQSSSHVLNLIYMKSSVLANNLKIVNGANIYLGFDCLGLGIMSFWWAIVLAYPQTSRLKIKYLISGTIGFQLLNILRICFIAIAYSKFKSSGIYGQHIDHHLVFNILTYILLAIFTYKWLQHPPLLKNKSAA